MLGSAQFTRKFLNISAQRYGLDVMEEKKEHKNAFFLLKRLAEETRYA